MRTWKEICEDPALQDLPYKIETNRFNQIVMSRSISNSPVEMEGKMQLCFARGAEEVWFCDDEGHMTFYRHDQAGAMTSKLCPGYPVKFEW